MSAFYMVANASLSVPAVIAGVAVTHLGLQATFETFGSVVTDIALVMGADAWRTRPRPDRPARPGRPVTARTLASEGAAHAIGRRTTYERA